MQEQTAVQGGAQTAQTGQTGQTPGAVPPEALSPEAFVNDILQMRGDPPGVSEGMDETQRLILENQYKQDTRNMIQDIETSIREVSPDITRADVQEFARAFVQGDPMAMWKAAQNASRKEAEAEQNDESTEDLRVEGGNSGSKGTEREPVKSMTEAALAISDAYA